MVPALIELARPKDWLKGVFIIMPVPFAIAAGSTLDLLAFVLGFAGFSLGASAVYAFNDAYDAELDRMHPTKRKRPVASHRVPLGAAFALSAFLLTLAVALLALARRPDALLILAVYVSLQVVYTLWARAIPLVDVFLLSSGFVIRVLLGCALVAAPASPWLLLCTSGLALFIALGKRRGDLVQGVTPVHRPSLSGYNQAFVDQAMTVTTAMTLLAYALYCIESAVLIPGREFATLPFVVFAVLDYLRRVQVKKLGDSPVDVVLQSPAILVCGLGWTLAALWSVRFP